MLPVRCTEQAGKSCTEKKSQFWSVKSSEWSKDRSHSFCNKRWELPFSKSHTHMADCPKLMWIMENLQTVHDVL